MPAATKKQGRVYGAIAIVLGLFIVIQAFPLFISSVLLIPGNPVLKRLQYREPVSAHELSVLISSREDALGWHEKGRTWTDLGLAHVALGEKLEGETRIRELGKARTALRKGLALAPANPYAWIRLAQVQLEMEGPSQSVADAVSLGLVTGPYEHLLLFPKLNAGLPVWQYLEQSDRATLARLTREAWQADARQTIDIYKQSGRTDVLFEILGIR